MRMLNFTPQFRNQARGLVVVEVEFVAGGEGDDPVGVDQRGSDDLFDIDGVRRTVGVEDLDESWSGHGVLLLRAMAARLSGGIVGRRGDDRKLLYYTLGF